MRRVLFVIAASMLVAAVGVAPAGADIDSNPHLVVIGPVACENGATFEAVWGPNDHSVVGHDPESNAVGIGKEFWVSDADGNKLQLLSRPLAPGFVGRTVFCWWPAEPFGYVGGEILFSGNVRP